MAEINGRLCICDRCGAQVFRKTTGDGEADGGWTRWNNFEAYPPGWDIVSIPYEPKTGTRTSDSVRVCPTCNKFWRDLLVEKFIKGTNLDVKSI
jgi:hypothetical protein